MLRVISGQLGGRRLRTLPGRTTRPTSDRVKEALFNILGPSLEGARVLDLFAGSGSLGIEALSRGAREAVFVERDSRARVLVRTNLDATGLGLRARLLGVEALAALDQLAAEGASFDLVFLDPPYGMGLLEPALKVLAGGRLLDAGARLVAEHAWREAAAVAGLAGGTPLRLVTQRRYGDTGLSIFTAGAGGDGAFPGEFSGKAPAKP